MPVSPGDRQNVIAAESFEPNVSRSVYAQTSSIQHTCLIKCAGRAKDEITAVVPGGTESNNGGRVVVGIDAAADGSSGVGENTGVGDQKKIERAGLPQSDWPCCVNESTIDDLGRVTFREKRAWQTEGAEELGKMQ